MRFLLALALANEPPTEMKYLKTEVELDEFLAGSSIQPSIVGVFWKEYKVAFAHSFHMAMEAFAKARPKARVAYLNEESEPEAWAKLERLNVNSTLEHTF